MAITDSLTTFASGAESTKTRFLIQAAQGSDNLEVSQVD